MLEPLERLRNAVIQGNLPITKRLVERFPELWLNIDPTNKGWCNLHYASFHGNYLICFYLVSFMNKNNLMTKYSQLDLLTFDGYSVLHLPMINHHSQTLHYLLQEFPQWINFPGGELKQTPLQYSCVKGFREGLVLLMEFGADYEQVDLNGDTCLHLCFQFGSFKCIEALFKFIITHNKDKETSTTNIKRMEEVKNKKGWCAIEYASSFDLIHRYGVLKRELLTLNFEDSMPLSEMSSANSSIFNLLNSNHSQTSLQENKILASPIIPMSQSQKDDTLTPTNHVPKGRAHSQSLPSKVPDSILLAVPTPPKNSSSRQRSNTNYNYKPPTPINANVASPRSIASPKTPVTQYSPLQKTPSLKSVTISPSVRNLEDADNSNVSSVNSSPVHASTGGRKKSQSVTSGHFQVLTNPIEENVQWPAVNSNAVVHEFSIPIKNKSTSPIHQLISPLPQRTATRSRRSSSVSSIAAKVAFNRSNLVESPRRRPSISTKSSDSSSSSNHTQEIGQVPELRKSRSSGTLPSPSYANILSKSSSTAILQPTKNNSTPSFASNESSDSLKRTNVSSVSFSRVR